MKASSAEMKRLDRAWREAVMARDGSKCFFCGAVEGICAHHLLTRGNRRVRHDLRNGITVCPACHFAVDGSRDTKRSAEMLAQAVRNNFKSAEEYWNWRRMARG